RPELPARISFRSGRQSNRTTWDVPATGVQSRLCALHGAFQFAEDDGIEPLSLWGPRLLSRQVDHHGRRSPNERYGRLGGEGARSEIRTRTHNALNVVPLPVGVHAQTSQGARWLFVGHPGVEPRRSAYQAKKVSLTGR